MSKKNIKTIRQIFRNSLKKGILLPGTYNALTAKLIEKNQFKGLYISGGALHASAGLTDTGQLSLNEFSFFAKWITSAVSIPCICDADTGFGDITATIQEYEKINLTGLHLEDQTFPKKCGHLKNKSLVSTQEMCDRIKQAIAARTDPNFIIIARTDARGPEGLENTIQRLKAYQEAGADILFPEALKTKEEFKTIAQNISAPLLANITEFGSSPLLSYKELIQMGYKLIIFPVSTLRLSAKITDEFLKDIHKTGTQKTYLDKMQTRQELYHLLGYNEQVDISP